MVRAVAEQSGGVTRDDLSGEEGPGLGREAVQERLDGHVGEQAVRHVSLIPPASDLVRVAADRLDVWRGPRRSLEGDPEPLETLQSFEGTGEGGEFLRQRLDVQAAEDRLGGRRFARDDLVQRLRQRLEPSQHHRPAEPERRLRRAPLALVEPGVGVRRVPGRTWSTGREIPLRDDLGVGVRRVPGRT